MSTTTHTRVTRATSRFDSNDDFPPPPVSTPENVADPPARRKPRGGDGPDDGDDGGDDGNGSGAEHHGNESDDLVLQFIRTMQDVARREVTPSIGSSAKTKVNAPTEYDGSDTKKLRSFLLQCNLVFRANPNQYNTDEKKITFALTYLRGPAQQHFDPYLEAEMEPGFDPVDHPAFMTSWREFGQELTLTFGDPNPEATAEAELDVLRMASSQKVQNFLVEFNTITSQLNWGQRALCHALYQSLPARLKDALSNAPHAETLQELKTAVLTLDRRYWERYEERGREFKTSSSSTNPIRNNTPRRADPSSKPPTSKPESSRNLMFNKPLTPEERSRRLAEKLCLYCGKAGHMAAECRLAQRKKETRGRKAETTFEASATGELSERGDGESEN